MLFPQEKTGIPVGASPESGDGANSGPRPRAILPDMDRVETVVICIGSDRVSGDMLGPLVGSELREKYRLPCPVYGWVGASVNGVNLGEYLALLREKHAGSRVIAVDAALGREEDVGNVRLKKGGIRAGGAMEKEGRPVGDLGVVGVVATERAPQEVYAALLEVPFDFVEALASRIARILYEALSFSSDATIAATRAS